MLANHPFNQKVSGFFSLSAGNLVILAAYNSLLLNLLNKTQPLWPQMDNLSGAKHFLVNQTDDYYTNSLMNSPRIFTIAILKVFALIFHAQVETIIAILGVLINIFGPLLFIMAVNGEMDQIKNRKATTIPLVPAFTLITILNMDILHKIEVNGFFINPFSQGATTSNLAFVIFLFGIIAARNHIRIPMFILSLLIHISTFLYLFILFAAAKNMRSWKSKIRKKPIITSVCFAIIVLLLLTMEHMNEDGWKYYVENRAPNHFVISTSTPELLRFALWALFGLSLIFNLVAKHKRCTLIFLGVATLTIFFSAYHYYALPFAIGFICMALNIAVRSVAYTTFSLLYLLLLQDFPIDSISVATSMLLPGTRYVAIVTFYLLTTFLFGIYTKFNKPSFDRLVFTKFTRPYKAMIGILIFSTLVCTFLSSKVAVSNFEILGNTIPSFSSREEIVNRDLIFLDVSSQGWREFGNFSIFVDEYPFWGNLTEYKKRAIFRSRIVSLIEKGELKSDRLRSVQAQFNVHQEITLISSRRNAKELSNLPCLSRHEILLCDLGMKN